MSESERLVPRYYKTESELKQDDMFVHDLETANALLAKYFGCNHPIRAELLHHLEGMKK